MTDRRDEEQAKALLEAAVEGAKERGAGWALELEMHQVEELIERRSNGEPATQIARVLGVPANVVAACINDLEDSAKEDEARERTAKGEAIATVAQDLGLEVADVEKIHRKLLEEVASRTAKGETLATIAMMTGIRTDLVERLQRELARKRST